MLLSPTDFLTLFKRDKQISEKQFINNYKVKTSNAIYKLKDYVEKKNINMDDR